MALYLDRMGEDPAVAAVERAATIEEMTFTNHGESFYGTALIPGGEASEVHPCVILCHGFPGFAATFDIAQNLRRVGFVVLSFFYRGSWGSQGHYTFSGAIDDAVTVAEWAHDEKNAAAYHIDRDNIFVFGHSMGGFVAINTTRRLPWLRGTVVMSPYNLAYCIENGIDDSLQALIDANQYVLRVASPTALYENAQYCAAQGYGISHAAEDLRDRNVYFIGAYEDDIARWSEMIAPLWNALRQHESKGKQQFDMLHSSHSYDDKRMTVSRMAATWFASLMA